MKIYKRTSGIYGDTKKVYGHFYLNFDQRKVSVDNVFSLIKEEIQKIKDKESLALFQKGFVEIEWIRPLTDDEKRLVKARKEKYKRRKEKEEKKNIIKLAKKYKLI